MCRGCEVGSHWVWVGKKERSGNKDGKIGRGQIAVAKEIGQWRRSLKALGGCRTVL